MPPLDSLRSALTDRLAAQWIALGVTLVGPAERSIVDLEALVAMTAAIGNDEPRIHEGAIDWCVAFGEVVHTGRLRAVAAELGVSTEILGTFAGMVAAAGGPRWPMASAPVFPYTSRRKVAAATTLSDPARLMWRVRATFGVNARADVIAALVRAPDRDVNLADLARRLRFTKRNIALACGTLRLAGVAEMERVGNEDRVRLAADSGLRAWLGRLPAGSDVDWVSRYGIVVGVLRFLEIDGSASPVARAIEARSVLEPLLPAIRRSGLPMPDTTVLGPGFAATFDAWCVSLARVLAKV